MADIKDVKIRMKSPLSYYGGKQKLARDICRVLYQSPNWSEKGFYIEPYFGGGAVFFAKEPQKMETINDLNDNLITFFRVVKDPAGFALLKALLDGTLYSRREHDRSARILKGLEYADDITRAWAVFVNINEGYGGGFFSGWLCNITHYKSDPLYFQHKKECLTEEICRRLENAHIDCRDALSVISSNDSQHALFYLDPPYAGTKQKYAGHNYKNDDLAALLEVLKTLKGRFILSGFSHPLIDEAAVECGWQIASKRCAYSINATDPAKKAGKTEVLIANYPFRLEGWEGNRQVMAAMQGELFA